MKAQRDWSRARWGAAVGVLSGAVAVGAGQLAAGITGANGSPVVAVGQLQIDLTPPALKNFAISAFGSHDKLVLVSGILVVLALFAAALGILAMRRLAYGLAGLAVLAVVGVVAASTRPATTPTNVLPTLAAAAAGAAAIVILIRVARAAALQSAPDKALPQQTTASRPGRPPSRAASSSAPAPLARPSAAPASTAPGGDPASPPGGPPQPSRRRFLVASAAAAGTAAAGVLAGRILAGQSSVAATRAALRIPAAAHRAPPLPAGTDLDIPGLSPFITANRAFYRVDTAIVLPQVAPESWMLRIHGMVAREIHVSFDELIHRPLTEHYITLCCVSNPVGGPYIGNAKWLGASLASLLRQAGLRPGASQLLCTSADGFTSGVPVPAVMDGRDALLAVAMNGTALPVAHGFPVRMVVPGLYGYVSACKWLTDIEVTTYQDATAYWVPRGWDAQAPIKTESRIDVPNGSAQLAAGPVRVAGVAWAQHKGIAAVEVRAGRGPWEQARLAAVPGIDTWRQWVWDWHATPGTYRIEARATDNTGYTQTAIESPPEPNGATGYPSVTVT